MCPMVDEYYTPPMYRDMMAGGMGLPFEFDPTLMSIGGMGGMYGAGMGMYNTNYLGGVTLRPNPSRDSFHTIKSKEYECKKDLITFGKVALGVIGLSILSGLFKGKKTPWYTKLANWASGHTPSRPVGAKKWYNPLTWVRKSPSTPPTP